VLIGVLILHIWIVAVKENLSRPKAAACAGASKTGDWYGATQLLLTNFGALLTFIIAKASPIYNQFIHK